MKGLSLYLFISYPSIKRLHNLRFLLVWIQSTNIHYPVILFSVSTHKINAQVTHSQSKVSMGTPIWRWGFTYKLHCVSTLHRSQELWIWLRLVQALLLTLKVCTIPQAHYWSVTKYTFLVVCHGNYTNP